MKGVFKQLMKKKFKNFNSYVSDGRIISGTNGRPSPFLTDDIWQQEFNKIKTFVTPYRKNIRQLGGKFSKDTGNWNSETQGSYYGNTGWQSYCAYINDVLGCIRSGRTDYCYYISQIIDLLKFHLNDLRTRYCGGYWEVWLESEKEA